MIKVLIVDDHELIRSGISRLLADHEKINVIGEASSGEEGITKSRELRPDVVLMDANMPGIGGLEATRRLLRFDPDIKVIAVTVHGDEPYPTRFMQAGAAGYITKGADIEEMVIAIRQVASGKRYLAPDIAQQMALNAVNPDEGSPFDDLSDREMQVMLMITRGQKVQDISEQLFLSPKTVNSYRYRLFEKLKIENDVELTHLAIRHGIIESEKL
ncbi:UvrY/SirA/GacA family response regulator transcription factor [Aliikangiella coralliicola]|uniref:UvrY/SirA/GacA family response regulator transcription factor n=1 Tax=Aliikangiella coralliicola TaxID=2592383 RepID=A0A545UAI9_9GAMM|nr:UvrY/SirA/GacA family response regulator transcription factor [Aliikangiella coralliicola]TQV86481.1 UvrY/SirA/GacA family response regulator transcription factor [Aliikangiella coralliicola]